MKLFADWKFILMLFITVAGVAVPVWLWQADLSAKSVSVKVISRVSLQPKEQEAVPGVEISVEGSRLENPHLAIFEIQNDGSKPIPAADFESALAVRVEPGASFVRARVTDRHPKDIEAEIATDKQTLTIKPTLLNPKDKITITAITSGSSPVFATKARIVGVSSVALIDETVERRKPVKQGIYLFSAGMLILVSMLVLRGISQGRGIYLRQRATVFIAVATLLPGTFILQLLLAEIGIQGYWISVFYISLFTIPLVWLASVLNSNQWKRQDGGSV